MADEETPSLVAPAAATEIVKALIIVGCTSIVTSVLTTWAGQQSFGVELSAMRVQMQMLQQDVKEMRRDMYIPLAGRRPGDRPSE